MPVRLRLRPARRGARPDSGRCRSEGGNVDSGPEPPRRALPSPLPSPPFPFSDWPYGGSPEIGVPDTDVPPLMQALYAGSHGAAWEQSRVKLSGWVAGSFNLSTSHNSNDPAVYDIFPNRIEFDQTVLYAERLPDTVQTDHFDWGFHLSGLYCMAPAIVSPPTWATSASNCSTSTVSMALIPCSNTWTSISPRSSKDSTTASAASSVPGIEAQLAPNNYIYTHSLLYVIDPFTDTGILGAVRLNDRWLVQLGLTASHDVAPWTSDARPSATACISYTFNQGNDNVCPCVNGLNDGRYSCNNLQMFGSTRYHKFNASWHMATEAWYMYHRGVHSISGPLAPDKGTCGAVCSAGEIRCFAPEWAMVNYLEKELSAKHFVSLRTDFLDDMKGQRTGFKTRYIDATLMGGARVGKHHPATSRNQIRSCS